MKTILGVVFHPAFLIGGSIGFPPLAPVLIPLAVYRIVPLRRAKRQIYSRVSRLSELPRPPGAGSFNILGQKAQWEIPHVCPAGHRWHTVMCFQASAGLIDINSLFGIGGWKYDGVDVPACPECGRGDVAIDFSERAYEGAPASDRIPNEKLRQNKSIEAC